MNRTPRRAASAPRLEPLEPRQLLDGAADRLFVKFASGVPSATIAADLAAVGGSVVEAYPDGSDLVALAPGADRARAVGRLEADAGVVYAEADASFHTSAAVYPNNPDFTQQWGLNSVNDEDIDAPEAWSVTTGTPSTIVAVIDTGIDLSNPAFAGRIWTNPDPSGSDGYPGDVNGWNFVDNSPYVQDNNGHGTHVAGILAAAGNDGIGVAGVDWNATIMPVKILDAFGNGTTDAAVSGIYYAVQHGAKVINASWGGGPPSPAMASAIAYAGSQGVVFVTAAGNDGTDSDVIPSYPGSYRLPNEIVVAAVDPNGNLASFSDYGARTVDLAAPGVNILSTVPGGFEVLSGTSMATPYVAGVVALLAGQHPDWSAAQLIQGVLATAKPDPSLAGRTITGGIVDAAQALGVAGSGQNGGGPLFAAAQMLAPVSLNPKVKPKVKVKVKHVAVPVPKPHKAIVAHPAKVHVVPARIAHPARAALAGRDTPRHALV
jgi:subtilisin family serine protease